MSALVTPLVLACLGHGCEGLGNLLEKLKEPRRACWTKQKRFGVKCEEQMSENDVNCGVRLEVGTN